MILLFRPPQQRARIETRLRYSVARGDLASGNVWRVNDVRLNVYGIREPRHLPACAWTSQHDPERIRERHILT